MTTFLAEVFAFLVIITILVRWKPSLPITLPTIRAALGEQQRLIAEQVREAEEARAKLGEAETAYKNALTEARTEAAQIREGARAEAQRAVEDMRTEAQTEQARIIARGDEQLDRQRAAIVRDLRAEIGTLAIELSERIVELHLHSEAEVRASVDSFIDELEAEDRTSGKVGGRP